MIEWNNFAKEMMKIFKDFTTVEAKQMQGILGQLSSYLNNFRQWKHWIRFAI